MVYHYSDSSGDDDDDEFSGYKVVDTIDSDIRPDKDKLKCPRCPRLKFNSVDELRRHKVKSLSTHYYCSICDEDFLSIDAQELHTYHSSKHITCQDCGLEFQSPGGLQIHLKTVRWT